MVCRLIKEVGVPFIETAFLILFHSKTFNDIYPLDSLVQESLHFRKCLGPFPRKPSQSAEEIPYTEYIEWENDHGHNRQLPVHAEHYYEGDDDCHEIEPDVHQSGHDEILRLFHIIDDP